MAPLSLTAPLAARLYSRHRTPGGASSSGCTTRCAPALPSAATLPPLAPPRPRCGASRHRGGINKKPGGRPTAHFSTVFPLEKTRMVIDGAAERRLQAIHRDRCTWWRAMVPPWCIHSLVRSLVCRVDRRPAAASDVRRWLAGRCELPHEDDWVSSAGIGAQQTTC